MILYLKNMDGRQSKIQVMNELLRFDIKYISISIGFVELSEVLVDHKYQLLKESLSFYGILLIKDKKNILLNNLKKVIRDLIRQMNDLPELNFSVYISGKLGYDYTYLANLFSEVYGYTIRQYIIDCKIEIVKEMLHSHEYNLTEISYKLHYSSVAHLSSQFKKHTGQTPTYFLQSNTFMPWAMRNV